MLHPRALKHLDWLFLAAVLGLTLLGIAFIWSATRWVPAYAGLARQQARWLGIGLLVFLPVLMIDYGRLGSLAYPAYGVILAALVYVLLFGVMRNNSRRWIGFFGNRYLLQPSELCKVAVVLALARYLMYRRNYRKWTGLIVPFLIVVIPMGLILRQPDLGTSLVFLPALFVMLYAAGASVRHLGAVAGAGLACTPLLWFFVMSARQKGRILGFLQPIAHASREGWHVRQSLAAIVSGGVTGNGIGSGAPVILNRGFAAHTDFIYSVIANEWGFLGTLSVLLLFGLLLSRGMGIAGATREPFGRLLVVGMLTMLAFQAFVNIGMTMRLCPITGLTLPFVSYGGSSLLTCLVMAGFVLNVGLRRKPVLAP